MQRHWLKLVLFAVSALLIGGFATACADGGDSTTPDVTPPVTMTDGLAPAFTNGQTWTVAASYRSQGVRMNELFKALTDEATDPTPIADAMPFVPQAVSPPEDELWSEPVYWTFGVITTAYVPDADNDFHRYSVDTDGTAQPVTILKVVADKDLNVVDIADTLDPVFYLIIRESDMRVRGIHYNYKVKSGRNTVVLELPENESELPAPGADQPFFLVPYMMPAFPMDAEADSAHEIALAGGLSQTVTPVTGGAEVGFRTSFDNSLIEQRWSPERPWYNWSISSTQRAWTLSPEQVVELGGEATTTDTGFLEPAESISSKFRNPINLKRVYYVEEGDIAASAPPSHIPWSGDYWSLKRGAAIFGWDSAARDELTTGPASSLKATVQTEMESVDGLFSEVIDLDRESDEFKTKRDEYFDKKRAVQKQIDDHFDGLTEKYRNGEVTLDEANLVHLGPLEKFDLYVMANKLGGYSYKDWGASRWEMQNQWNPGGPGWWGHCNGWAAAGILTEQPTEPVSVSIPLNEITGEDRQVTLEFQPGDLKALASLSYYTGYSHFYGERYNGEEQDLDDIHPHVFHRIITYYIGEEKFPFVMDTTATEEVWNFPAYAYDGTIVEDTDFETDDENPDRKRAFLVEMTVIFGTDSVDEEYIADDLETQENFTQRYEYTLYTDDNGKVIDGVWISENHPDFAWVAYGNNTSFGWRSKENPAIIVDAVENLFTKRDNAPRVCDAAANDGAGDCPGDLSCNSVNGVCVEAATPPPSGETCAGGATRETAVSSTTGTTDGLGICANRDSWYEIPLTTGDTLTATVTFRHSDGDVDLGLSDDRGETLGSSGSTSDQEQIVFRAQADRSVFLRVYGYNGAANEVALTVDVAAGQAMMGCTEEEEAIRNNDTRENAPAITQGSVSAGICDAESDYFRVTGIDGGWTATTTFSHAEGDLDLAVLDLAGNQVDGSQGTTDTESARGEGEMLIRVYGYSQAQGNYTLDITPQ